MYFTVSDWVISRCAISICGHMVSMCVEINDFLLRKVEYFVSRHIRPAGFLLKDPVLHNVKCSEYGCGSERLVPFSFRLFLFSFHVESKSLFVCFFFV